MDPLQVLTDSSRETSAADSAPAAAKWLDNPTGNTRQLSLAQQLAAEPEWTGPDNGTEENPAE